MKLKKIKAFYDPKTKTAIASTNSVDRMGEVINQDGWDLGNFKDNPVLLWGHDDKLPRIGLAKNLRVEKSANGSALMFEPVFNEASELARTVKQLFEEDGGTFSVGFMPLEMDGNTFTKSELLEISAVNVPANPDARVLSYKSMRSHGVSRDIAELLTGAKGAIMDELNNPDVWEVKSNNMNPLFDIFYAFCDVYFDYDTDVEDFPVMLKECIQLFGKVANGTFASPTEVTASFKQVLDKHKNQTTVEDDKAKGPSSAPSKKYHEERLSMAKVMARATEILLKDERQKALPSDERTKVIKSMKRASEIIVAQHKGELKNG